MATPNDAPDSDEQGGQGGPEQFDIRPQTSDTRLMERAIKERWPMPLRTREAVVRRLLAIVADANASKREIVAASRALIAADKLNLVQEERDNPTPKQHEHTVVVLPPVERATIAVDTLRAEANRRGLVIDASCGSPGIDGEPGAGTDPPAT